MKKLCTSLLVVVLLSQLHLFANSILQVGSGQTYTTVTAALAKAEDGDVIVIMDKTHTENGIIVDKSVTIEGNDGPFENTIDGGTTDPLNPQGRIFNIAPGKIVTIKNLTISNGGAMKGGDGSVPGDDGADGESGGAIYNYGDQLTVINCIFKENYAGFGGAGVAGNDGIAPGEDGINGGSGGHGGSGGAIVSEGKLVIENCTFEGNVAGAGGLGANGGAGADGADGDTEFPNGMAGGNGGAAGNGGNGGNGGAIFVINDTVVITNSTFYTNRAGDMGIPGLAAGNGGHGGVGYDTKAGYGGNGGSGGHGGNAGWPGKSGGGGAIAVDTSAPLTWHITMVNNTLAENVNGNSILLSAPVAGNGGDGGAYGTGPSGDGQPGQGGNGGDGAHGIVVGNGGGVYTDIGEKFGLTILLNNIIAGNTLVNPLDVSGYPGGSGGRDYGLMGGFGDPGDPGDPGTMGVGPECYGWVNSEGFNILIDNTGSMGWTKSDILDDPELSPLADNGGPTTTMAINEKSIAESNGKPIHKTLHVPTSDQRGFSRPNTGTIPQNPDIGAYEYRTIPSGIIINEVDVDQTGTDDAEFIEIYDGGSGNTPLDELVVVLYNGNDDESYDAIELEGYETDANGYFVIGSNNVPNADLISFTTNGLQQGADAVALYKGIEDTYPDGTLVTVNDSLIDALVYDTDDSDDADLLQLLLGGGQVNENEYDASETESMQRIPNGVGGRLNTSKYTTLPPTPGEPNEWPVPTIAFSTDSIGFGEVHVGDSAELSYHVTGSYLHGDMRIDVFNGFKVSETSGSGYDNSILLPVTDREVDADVYVQFKPTNPIQYIDSVRNIISPDSSVFIDVTGTGIEPTIITSLDLLDFGNVEIGDSAELSYTVEGEYLKGDIEISIPSGDFTISADQVIYGNNIVLTENGGSAGQNTIYVKYKPTDKGNDLIYCVHTSTGATNDTVDLSGTGINPGDPLVNTSVSELAFGNVIVNSASILTYTVEGENLTDDINITVPLKSGYKIAKSETGTYLNEINLIPDGEGTVPTTTIYVRFIPEKEVNYSNNITNTSQGVMENELIALSGDGVIPEISFGASIFDGNFGNVLVGNVSKERSYSISGNGLVGNIEITAPEGFEISETSGTGFTSFIELVQTGGSVSATDIYVRFNPLAAEIYDDSIVHVSTGADTIYKNVTGTGTTVGIEELLENEIILYPVPTRDIVYLKGNSNSINYIKVQNMLGNVVLEKAHIKNLDKIDLSSLPDGIYFIVIQTKDAIITKQVQKMR
jgi:hypothetical protein